jgi:hypothetical protein
LGNLPNFSANNTNFINTMSEFEETPNASNTETLKTQESLEKEAEQPVLLVKEQIKNLEGKIEAHQQEIARISTVIEETNVKLNEVRENLGLESDEEDISSTLSERDELDRLKAELQALEKQKEELVSQQENELRAFLIEIDELDQSTLEGIYAEECYERLLEREFETNFIRQTVEKTPFADTPAQNFFAEWCRINDSIVPQFIDREAWENRGVQGILEKNDENKQTLFLPHDLHLWEMMDIIKTVDHDTLARNPEKKDERADKIQELGKIFEKAGLYLSEYHSICQNTTRS